MTASQPPLTCDRSSKTRWRWSAPKSYSRRLNRSRAPQTNQANVMELRHLLEWTIMFLTRANLAQLEAKKLTTSRLAGQLQREWRSLPPKDIQPRKPITTRECSKATSPRSRTHLLENNKRAMKQMTTFPHYTDSTKKYILAPNLRLSLNSGPSIGRFLKRRLVIQDHQPLRN
jgi:hypothetical protein